MRIEFGVDGSERYEVVPASIERTIDNIAVYMIPSPAGGWMVASPERQKQVVSAENTRLFNDLKPFVRFLKLWKYANAVPISSYYLEVAATRCLLNERAIIHALDLREVFGLLWEEELPALENLGGIGGAVSPCATHNRAKVLDAVLEAYVDAKLAVERDHAGKTADAFAFWNQLFKGRFPSFG